MMSNEDTNSLYKFTPTQDWFSFHIDTWRSLFPLVQSPRPRVLEIGSWEGRSAVFMLTELCATGGEVVCIDHFDLMETDAGRERYAKITHNLSLTGKPFRILDDFSVPALMMLLQEEMSSAHPGFDWIYIDGSHEADDTFLDGELAWRLARQGAIMIFDDYHWDKEPEDSIHHPKRGIDAFMTLHAGEFELLTSHTQYQVVLRKSCDMRIGFLVKGNADHGLDSALGYGVHVVLTIDSPYAMAAAVTIRSAIAHTSGRLTIYVINAGLTEEDKDRIRASAPVQREATIVFLSLPKDSFARAESMIWAKIDMIPALPVERVLYLDADLLVRGDLRELWDTDLQGRSLAAVTDVGYPRGHKGPKRPYFNAGVLLMDLAKIRGNMDALRTTMDGMTTSRFRDQDALNVHFDDDWVPLSLKWNAQGLGTYAELPSADRTTISLAEMHDPRIVHFTGPVSPEMEKVLNPYVQPYTAKPWGYAGAPGHPYQEEWWKMLEGTAWKGWRQSDEYCASCVQERDNAMRAACDRFRQRVGEAVVIH
ncbi:glycosyltransferase family 8 protein [Laetiporus sulphureus 93-53]|uniref:Glycosyltransferase family 8 protein n=1 Tax=Laetiporus sulphureus 93-53 TaxID=1314785 RepID=A0A165I734_9APHY|nr:glycosyltransferase family 8 protein [Laetiporus sulphureus 93-53]KZT12679.1 glycosyltransferase family 8 protein [Laetiporus sulphureus 93-53]